MKRSSTYNIPDLPSGGTITWTVSPAIANPSSNTGNPITLTGIASGEFTLTAQVTACGSGYTVSKQIRSGTPTLAANYTYNGNVVPMQIYSGTNSYNPVCNLQQTYTAMQVNGATSVVWSKVASNPTSVDWSQNGNDLSFYLWSLNQTAVFRIEATNSCGTTSYDFGFKSVSCGSGGGGGCAKYSVANTSKSSLRVVVPNTPAPCRVAVASKDSSDKDVIALVKVYDMSGRLLVSKNFSNAKTADISSDLLIPGVYVIEISDGKNTERQKVIVIK